VRLKGHPEIIFSMLKKTMSYLGFDAGYPQSLTIAPFPPIQFQKKSPREKEKAWKSRTGRGRRRVGTRAERTIRVRATTHAERAKLVGMLAKIGSSVF